MDNRVVALAALENLIHWPLPDRSGFVTSAFASGGSEDGEDGDGGSGGGAASAWVSAGDAEDVGREPRQRTLDRYRAVLLLPFLCQKLGSRWVESEVVPYLLRCVEEADPQLAVVTGMAMLGVTLPRRAPLRLAPSSTSASATTTGGSGANKLGAFLSVEEVQPVCALMAASSIEETRRFAAQVVLPHLHFGVALERDLTLESWDVKYVPLAVLQAETSAGASRTSAVAAAASSSSDVDGDGHADAAAARARLVAAVRKHMQRQYQQLVLKARQSKAAPTPSASAAGEAAASKGSARSGGTLEGSGGTPTPPLPAPPTTDDVRRRCRALAEEDERAQFLFSGDYAALTGPWCFEEPGRLSSLVNGTRVPAAAAACGGSGSGAGVDVPGAPPHGGAVGNAFCSFRRHRRRVDNGETLRGLPPATCLPLAGADLDLYGADYASDSDVSGSAGGARGGGGGGGGGSSGDDFFSVNVRARALVADLVRWMEALTPAAPTAAASSAAAVPAKSTRLHVNGCLTLFDYLSCDERRDVLRSRWRGLVKALQGLLESPYPGPVAVATELISQLLQAIQLGLWEAEQQHLRTKLKHPVHGDKGDAAGAEEADGCWCGIRVPASPLLTTAELQSFFFRMTRRHVAYCVAAAVSARTVPLPAMPTPASMKVLTDSIGRLVRSALATAQATLMDLLVRHHVLLRLDPSALSSAAAAAAAGSTSGRPSMLQIGAGPGESRFAALAAWDVSFANSGVTAATPGTAAAAAAAVDSVTTIGLPDDATFLLNFERGTGADTTASGGASARAWLPGTLNAASGFRLHRLVRRALLRAVPLCVDFFCLFYTSAAARAAASPVGTASVPTSPLTSSATAASGSSASSAVSLAAVCPMLLQVLVPQRALAPLLDVVCVSAQLQHNHSGGAAAAPPAVAGYPTSRTSATTRHADPAARDGGSSEAARAAGDAGEGALPAALLAALLSPPAAAVDADGSGSGALTPAEECPASVDFGVLEAALDAVQRLMAEAAAHLVATAPRTTQMTRAYGGGAGAADVTASPAAPPGVVLDGVCEQLFALLSACLRWVPRYTSWKARWLIAQRLPRLVASFCFFLARVNTLPATDGEGAASTMHQRRAHVWLSHTLTLLRSLWVCAAQFGVAPLNDLMDDEEIEVRCLAVGCAARCFSAATEATLRVCMTGPRGAATASRSGPTPPQTLSAELRESLSLLLDATAQCVLVAASDGDARVRCRSAEALSTLSSALSLLVVADRPAPVSGSPGQQQPQQQGASASPCVWSRYLHSNTDALLRLMMDDRPTVQLALVSQLTDVLLMRMWGPSAGEADEGAAAAVAAAPAGAGGDGQRTADGVQYEALLQCLRQLARHELWRLREQYAVLLAHLCGRLLLTAAQSAAAAEPAEPAAAHLAGGAVGHGADGASANSHTPALPGSSSSVSSPTSAVMQRLSGGSLNADADARGSAPAAAAAASSWAHTHPLYQLARTELLTLLVAVLFDKVKAVRDAALDAVEEMCMQLASSSSSSSGSHAGAAAAAAGLNANTFVDDVLWPRIRGYAPAWETYLSRSSLLRIAMRLRVDKTSVFIPLLDQLARDPVLNVRLVVAKITLEVLLRSSSSSPSMQAPTAAAGVHEARDGGEKASASAHADSTPATAAAMSSSYKPELPSGTVAYSILMDKPVPAATCGSVVDGGLPPLCFDEEERTGVVLQILRQLLKDASSDVRDEAAKALKVCF